MFDLAADPAADRDGACAAIPCSARSCAGGPGCACPARGTRSSARCARCSGSRSASRPDGRSRAGSWSAAGRRFPRPTDDLTHLFPSPARGRGRRSRGPRAHVRPVPRRSRRSRAAVAEGRLDLRAARGRGGRRPRRAPGHRRLDGAVRRAARVRGAGRVSRRRPRACARPPRRARRSPRARSRCARRRGGPGAATRCSTSGRRRLPSAARGVPWENDHALRRDRFAGRAAAGGGGRRRAPPHPLPEGARAPAARRGLAPRLVPVPVARPPARRVLRPRAARVRPDARARGHAVPARDVAGAAQDPLRHARSPTPSSPRAWEGPRPRGRSGPRTARTRSRSSCPATA